MKPFDKPIDKLYAVGCRVNNIEDFTDFDATFVDDKIQKLDDTLSCYIPM